MTSNRSSPDWRILGPEVTEPVRGIFGSICLVLAFTGVLGNFFVCFAVFRTNMMRNSINILIANLAFADLLQSLNILTFSVTLFSGEWHFGETGCQISGYIMMSMIFASMYILGLISLNRYNMINMGKKCKYLFTVKGTSFTVLLVWIFALIVSSFPLYGYEWAAYEFYNRRSLCSLIFHRHSAYFITYSAILLVPLSMISYYYWKIFKKLRKNRLKIHDVTQREERKVQYWKNEMSNSQISIKIAGNENDRNAFCITEPGNQGASSDGVSDRTKNAIGASSMTNITLMLFVIVVIFILVYMPTFILNMINVVNPSYIPNVWLDMSFIMLALANHTINPLVYGVMNKQYRKAFKHYCFIC